MPLPDRGVTFKIFLGNLAEGVTNEEIRPLFEAYGEVVECDVVGNYGFVHMRNAPEGEAAIATLNGHNIRGKSMRVEASKSKPPSKPSVKIFVGNLPEGTNTTELKSLFEQYGAVLECDVLKNFAFIHMEKGEPSNRAIRELNSYNYQGNPINVQLSTSRVRTKPGMGQPDQCYRCGKSGHWSKECPADRYGGGSFGGPRGAPRGGRDAGYTRGPSNYQPPPSSNKMYSRRYEDDYYGGSGGGYSDYSSSYGGSYSNGGGNYSYDTGSYSSGGNYASDYPSSSYSSYGGSYTDYGSSSGGGRSTRGGSRVLRMMSEHGPCWKQTSLLHWPAGA